MNPVSAVVVFIVIWWLVLFMVLPWGVRRTETPEAGHDPGAPAKPMLWQAETPKGGAEVTFQEAAADTFQECAAQLKADRATCADTFPDDNDGEGVCNEGSKARFLGCVKTLDAPAAG